MKILKIITCILIIILQINTNCFAKSSKTDPDKNRIGEASEIKAEKWLNYNGVPTLKSLKGKYILLEFWATWCAPCRENIPHMNEIYDKYNGSELQILSVTDESLDTVTEFLTEYKIDYPIGVESPIFRKYNVRARPFAVIIDKEGYIIWKGVPIPEEIRKVLNSIVGYSEKYKNKQEELYRKDNLEIIATMPSPASALKIGEKFFVKIKYNNESDSLKRIYFKATKYKTKESSQHYISKPSNILKAGENTLDSFLYFNDFAEVKEIQVTMVDMFTKKIINEKRYPVNLRWLPVK